MYDFGNVLPYEVHIDITKTTEMLCVSPKRIIKIEYMDDEADHQIAMVFILTILTPGLEFTNSPTGLTREVFRPRQHEDIGEFAKTYFKLIDKLHLSSTVTNPISLRSRLVTYCVSSLKYSRTPRSLLNKHRKHILDRPTLLR